MFLCAGIAFLSIRRIDEAHYRQALALAEPRGMRPLIAHCHLGLSKTHRYSGKCEQVQEHLAIATTMFTRRLRGVAIDFMLFLVAMVVALQIATALNRDDVARIVGVGFLACYFLYETLATRRSTTS